MMNPVGAHTEYHYLPHAAQRGNDSLGAPMTAPAQTDPGGGRGVVSQCGYSAASRRGSTQFGRMKWQVYPFGIRSR